MLLLLNDARLEECSVHQRVRQTPISGAAYIKAFNSNRAFGEDPPVASAYDASGNLLGQAQVPDWQIRLALSR